MNTSISIRISSSSDLDAVNAASLKNSGVDFVDVLGVPLTVSQIQTFLSDEAPILQNAQLLISNDNVSEASALLQQSFDRDIFDAGITGFGVAAVLLRQQMYGRCFLMRMMIWYLVLAVILEYLMVGLSPGQVHLPQELGRF